MPYEEIFIEVPEMTPDGAQMVSRKILSSGEDVSVIQRVKIKDDITPGKVLISGEDGMATWEIIEQYFHLSAPGTNITTIANFFGANSNISLVPGGYYEIDIWAWFLKTTAGTVTWTLTNSGAPTGQNIYFRMSPPAGIPAPPGAATFLEGAYYNDTQAVRAFTTASLTTAVNHFAQFKIFLRNNTGTSLKIQATSSAGSITPGINSYWFCKQRNPGNVGTFAP